MSARKRISVADGLCCYSLWAVYDCHTVGLLACVIVMLNVTEPQPCDEQGNRLTSYILSGGVPGQRDFQCGFPI